MRNHGLAFAGNLRFWHYRKIFRHHNSPDARNFAGLRNDDPIRKGRDKAANFKIRARYFNRNILLRKMQTIVPQIDLRFVFNKT
jgi:hypothetical protein